MKPHPKWVSLIVWIVLLAGAVSSGAGPALAQEAISYRLKWLINASTAGDVMAKRMGFFAAEGFDVAVKAGGPERDAIRELELGYAQFGVASADQVIRALAKGARVVVLAQLFQVNPLQWIYRTGDLNLASVRDLAGHSIGVTYGGNDETILHALLDIAGMNAQQVQLASVRYDYTPFLRNQVAIWPVYRNTQGILLADKLSAGGEPVAFFDPSRFGVRFVANSLVTSRKLFDDHPQTAVRFTRALLSGWQAAMAPVNEDAVVQAVAEHDRDTPETILRRQLAATREMVQPDPTVAIGHIDVAAWQQTETIMLRQRLIQQPVTVTDWLHPPLAD